MPSRRLILSYPPDVVQEPVTYQLVKDYDLKINILKARIRPREGGRLVIEISGQKKDLEAGLAYLTGLGIDTRTLVRDIRIDPDKCCHCTACVPICPTGALQVDRDDWQVSLDHDKCVLCETCVTVCPYRAIDLLF
ncbi:MAG: 4Fe-4S binding protein [Deltaproteobacteria bacterium]|nr:4Fe-4S binding protein [Deltaproteobacteria bacterium]